MTDESSGAAAQAGDEGNQDKASGGTNPAGSTSKSSKKVAKTLEESPGGAAASADRPKEESKGDTEAKSGKKVAKTVEENPRGAAASADKPKEESTGDTEAKSGKKVAKTVLEHNVADLMDEIEKMTSQGDAAAPPSDEAAVSSSPSMPEMPPPPPPPPGTGSDKSEPVARTMLDHEILWDQVAKAAAAEEIKVIEQIKERANEPVKPFQAIEKYKKSTPCSSQWDNPDAKERFTYCAQCQLNVYDFSGMELPEAEELIFKRENRKTFTLFKRLDGKFLTTDCPVGIKRKRDLMMASVGGVVLVACVLGLLLTIHPEPKPAPTHSNQGPDATADEWSAPSHRGNAVSGSNQGTVDGTKNQAGTGGTSGPPVEMFNEPSTDNTAKENPQPAQPAPADENQYWEYAPKADDVTPPAMTVYPTAPAQMPGTTPPPTGSEPGSAPPDQPASDGSQPAAPATAQPRSNGVQYYGK